VRAAAPVRIGIVGGGFSGAMVAVQLARLTTEPIAIDIIEPRPVLGGGVAYSATDPSHRINVPAARMTVFAEDPAQFDRWLRAGNTLDADPAAIWDGDLAFPQRAIFGHYIAELVAQAARTPGVSIRHHSTSVTDITAHSHGYTLHLQSAAPREADILVLAASHPPPAIPRPLRAVVAAGAPVIADPWAAAALDAIPPTARVLIVGTGLTMADVVATLDRRGHQGSILAVSRRGLLSRGHVFLPADQQWCWAETVPPPATATALVRAIRSQVAQAQAAGVPWQLVFDDIRRHAARLWTALPETEQRRIVTHIRPFWDVHRFRIAPQIEAAIARRSATGQFSAMAASLVGASWNGEAIEVKLHPRQAAPGLVETRRADWVINTTGPDHRSVLTGNPAMAALLRQGLLRPDRVGLGIDVDPASHPIGNDGAARPDLLISGPLARGRFGELMGLPQVSEHAEFIAATIIAEMRARAGHPAANADAAE
jgi:uncharacterized NAD(P)/FAD-binding protein YdhS